MVTFANFSFIYHVASSIDHVYFATSRGITRFNKNENRWEQPLTGSTGIDHRDIKRVWVDTFDEKLFVETGLGYYEYDLLFGKWFGRNELPAISNDARHVGAPPVMYPPISFNYSSEGRLFDAAGRYFDYTDVLNDNSGMLWIGTWGNGALRAGETSGIIELMPFGLLQNRVNAIYREDSIIFAGGAYFDSYRSGISILNIETG
ncbi:MAG: hypothetical protein KAT79_04915, partial [candidate division Zixibacteria bacterium]|nr:hypothetical protein [candidate division Zixibacteria bacterium]